MLHKNVITQKGGFRTLDANEIDAVGGGFGNDGGFGDLPGGPGPQLTEADIRFQMQLQTLSTMQKADFLDQLGRDGGLPSPLGGDGYDKDKDYCGSSWVNLPDEIWGVDISYACYLHDKNYGPDSTMSKSEADWKFVQDIYSLLVDGGVSEGLAADTAMFAHGLVMAGGWPSYQGQGGW